THDRLSTLIHIDQPHRPLDVSELLHREHFHQFFQGADPAGKADEGIGKLFHAGLALSHGLNHLELTEARVRDFPIDELARNYSNHFTAGLQGGISRSPHQPDVAATVDHAPISTPKPPTQL